MNHQPYRAEPSGQPLLDVLQQVNAGCAYFSEGGLNLANSQAYFRTMLRDLNTLESRRFGTVHDFTLCARPVNTAIRVDVDMDLVAAAGMARIAEQEKIPLTFYLLHTAPYYGSMQHGVFRRNEANAYLYRLIQQSGAEIGLHIDALELYLRHGIDGAEAIRTELTWLRGEGLRIRGTSSHNCAPVYGAENFEIFAGRSINGQRFVQREQRWFPLSVLDESELGLEYTCAAVAANGSPDRRARYLAALPPGDFLRDEDWFRLYVLENPYCVWESGLQIWLLGRDLWAIGGYAASGAPVFRFGLCWGEVIDFMRAAAPEDRMILVLHPIYLSRRSASGEPPQRG